MATFCCLSHDENPTSVLLLFPRSSQIFLECIPLFEPPPLITTILCSMALPMCFWGRYREYHYSHGLYNLQGPKLFTGIPSLFCIVEPVLRSDLESVLTGNQQFLRWSNGLHYDGGQWGWQERWEGRARKDDNRFPLSFPFHVFFPFYYSLFFLIFPSTKKCLKGPGAVLHCVC